MPHHDDAIWSVCWMNNGKIVSGSVDGKMKIWTANSLVSPTSDAGEESVVQSQTSAPQKITWNINNLSCESICGGHKLGVVKVSASEDNEYVVSSSIDGILRIWNPQDGTLAKRLNEESLAETWATTFSQDRTVLFATSSEGRVFFYDLTKDDIQQLVLEATEPDLTNSQGMNENNGPSKEGKFMLSVAMSKEGTLEVASGCENGAVYVWDMSTLQVTNKLVGHMKPVRSVEFTNDGFLLASASDDKRMNLYDYRRGGLYHSFTGHGSWVTDLSISPDGRTIATCSADHQVKIWDIGMRKCIHTFDDASEPLWSVDFCKIDGGKTLVVGGEDGYLRLHNLKSFL